MTFGHEIFGIFEGEKYQPHGQMIKFDQLCHKRRKTGLRLATNIRFYNKQTKDVDEKKMYKVSVQIIPLSSNIYKIQYLPAKYAVILYLYTFLFRPTIKTTGH